MRKKTIFFVLVILSAFCVSAVGIDSVIAAAKENSSVYQGYERSHKNTLISQEQKDLSKVTFYARGGATYAHNASNIQSTEFKVTIPDAFNAGINVVLDTVLSPVYLEKTQKFTLTNSLDISKTFNLNSFSDTREDIQNLISDLNVEKNYLTNVFNFENNVINSVISIIQASSNLEQAKTSLQRLENSYNNDVKLGVLVEGSLTQIERKMNIDRTRVNFENQQRSYEKSLRDFKQQYGIDYVEVTEARNADLSFEISETGNSTVKIAMLDLETAKQDLDAKTGTTDTLKISGGAKPVVTFNNGGAQRFSIDLNTKASYTHDKIQLDASISDTLGKGLDMIPSVSISGTWNNGSASKSKSDQLDIQKAQNAVYEKQSSYDNALYNYRTNASNLQNDIEKHENDVAQLEIQTEYHKTILENQTKLYEKGLITKQSLDDARTTYNSDLQQALILRLQALVLENRIKTIEL